VRPGPHRRRRSPRAAAALECPVCTARRTAVRRAFRRRLKRRVAMPYVDGFLIPVPRRNREKYKKMSTQAGKVWMDHGALGYHECVADDVKPGKQTSFPKGVKLRKGEEVWFSWIVYRSRKDRDRVNARAMK